MGKRKKWTLEEDQYIKDNIGKVTFSDMATYCNCAIATVEARARALGFQVNHPTQKRWTLEETQTLIKMAPDYTHQEIAAVIGKNPQEIINKAKRLGITLIYKKSIWTEEMIQYLKENYGKVSVAHIVRRLDISREQVNKKAAELGLEPKSYRWSDEEINTLREMAPTHTSGEIAKVLERNQNVVISKAKQLGIKCQNYETRPLSEEELNYIKDNWGKIPVTTMAKKLKIGPIVVQRHANSMGLPKLGNNPYKKWTPEKITELRELAKTKTKAELAEYYKTTPDAIRSIAQKQNIDLINDRICWSEEEIERIKEIAPTMDIQSIAREMHKSVTVTRSLLQRYNIPYKANEKKQKSTWTKEDTKKLRQLINDGRNLLEIVRIMDKRDTIILKKAKEHGWEIENIDIGPWSEKEEQRLIELAKTKKVSELVLELNRTSTSIKEKAERLGITLISDRPNWTKDELEELTSLLTEGITPAEIAVRLNRSEEAIYSKIRKENLQHLTDQKGWWSEEEKQILMDMWGTYPPEVIAKELNRSIYGITGKAKELSLGSQINNNYSGITIPELCSLFNIHARTIDVYWVILGLKIKTRKTSQVTSYRYVEINDLWDFLEKNQNIWDSRYLEKNILGKEPDWMAEKRIHDQNALVDSFNMGLLTRQQTILTDAAQEAEEETIIDSGMGARTRHKRGDAK